MKTLTEKLVLITGAGSGIGRETALLFAEQGATVVLVGRRLAPIDAVAKEIRAQGRQAHVRSVDLEDGEAAAELGQWTLEQFGKVDVLVNNAGHSSKTRSIRYVGTDDWQSVFKVNVEGVYRLTQSLIESMIAKLLKQAQEEATHEAFCQETPTKPLVPVLGRDPVRTDG